jgi:hypothetical protein
VTVEEAAELVLAVRKKNRSGRGWEREFVYFISSGSGVKIGFTKQAPEDRLADFQKHHYLEVPIEHGTETNLTVATWDNQMSKVA